MLFCTNYKSKKGLKLIKQMSKRKLKENWKLKTKTKINKMKWNSIDIRYENHEKKKVTYCGQRQRTQRQG